MCVYIHGFINQKFFGQRLIPQFLRTQKCIVNPIYRINDTLGLHIMWVITERVCVCVCVCVLFTRGGLNLCSLGPTQQSVALHRQSTHSALTYNSTDTHFNTENGLCSNCQNHWAQTGWPAYQNILRMLFSFSASARCVPPLDVMPLAERLEHRNYAI